MLQEYLQAIVLSSYFIQAHIPSENYSTWHIFTSIS